MQRLLETGAEDERTQEATKFLELLLCLLRNLLVVPDSGSGAHNGPRARTCTVSCDLLMRSLAAISILLLPECLVLHPGNAYTADMQEEFIRQLRSERVLEAIIVRTPNPLSTSLLAGVLTPHQVLCKNVQQEQNRAYAPLLLDILCALYARSRPGDISAARATAAQVRHRCLASAATHTCPTVWCRCSAKELALLAPQVRAAEGKDHCGGGAHIGRAEAPVATAAAGPGARHRIVLLS